MSQNATIIAECLCFPLLPHSLCIFVTPIHFYLDTCSTMEKSTNITNGIRKGNWYTKWLNQLTTKLFHLNAITSVNCICQYIRRRCTVLLVVFCCCFFLYFSSMKWKTNETGSVFVCRCQNNNKSIMAFHQLCKRLFIAI